MHFRYKISSTFLIALLAMPIILCGYFMWHQHLVKEEMEERLEKSNLTQITILKQNIQWVEAGKELIIDAQMFDVKSIEEKGDTLYIKGLYDVAEKKIKQKIASLLHQKNDSNSPLQKVIEQFFNPIICNKNNLSVTAFSSVILTKTYVSFKQDAVCQIKNIDTPPPIS